MNKGLIYTIILLFTLLIASCAEDAVMIFYNNTASTTEIRIDNITYQLPAYQTLERKWSLNRKAFSVDKQYVTVQINEKLFLFPQQYTALLSAGSRVYKSIDYDAAGLRISNESSSIVTEVYISPSTSQLWGSNKLESVIMPEDSARWNLAEGFWDIKIVNNWGNNYTYFEQRFFVKHLHSIDIFDGKTNTDDDIIKINGIYETLSNEYPIEQID
ncbi:MAG: hypothetical protein K0B81_00705 [Candidatus Cloacimonetes bacterium]|nr:hypothetical protein [Candidatus Cloacimonadota bacterium]